MIKKELLTLINVLFICLILVWNSVQLTLLEGFDGKGRVLLLLSIVIFLHNLSVNSRYRTILFSKGSAFKFWFLWFLYASFNTIFQYNFSELSIETFLGIYLFVPFVIMSTMASLSYNYLGTILKLLGFAIYIAFILFFLTAGEVEGRFMVESFDPNEFSLIIYLLIIIISIGFLLKKLNVVQALILLTPPIYFSIMLGSRMGFIGVMVLLLGILIVSSKRNKFISKKKIFITIALLTAPILFVINNTVVGERLQGTTENSENLTTNYAEGTVFEKFGDRGVYYILGWEAFKDAPIIGIGLRNFQDNYYYTVLHSEFMVQLAELGLVGFALYLLFLYALFKAIKQSRRSIEYTTPLYNYLYFIYGVVLIASSVLFLYHSLAASIIFGLLIFLTKDDTVSGIMDSQNVNALPVS